MNQKLNFTIIISGILLYSLVLNSCAETTTLAPIPVPTLSQTPLPSRTNVPSVTTTIISTPILNNKTIILTPDDLFSLSGLEVLSTPDSEDICEHRPSQTVTNPDRFSLLSGRFVLCIWEMTNTAMDLDTGTIVSTDDGNADIAMGSVPWGSNENPGYGVIGWNNAYISNAYVLEEYANHSGANHLSYEYCENLLGNQPDPGAMVAEEGAIACVKTTDGKIALIRVERIYPPNTLSVEFAFAILRDE